jgi:hypothetical protein
MRKIIFSLAVLILSLPVLAQRSVYISDGASVYVSRGQTSAYITAVPARRMDSAVSRTNNDNGFVGGFRNSDETDFFNRPTFNAFNASFPSVYMWGNGWLGRPLIDTGSIGRPLIDTGSFGRPGIDAGIDGSSSIPRNTLRRFSPTAARSNTFGGHTIGAVRRGAVKAGGGGKFGAAK